MASKFITILGIESSCDETSAAVVRDGKILANIINAQKVHEVYGGIVPELASRAHQQNIVPVVSQALKIAGIDKNELNAIAYTRGPGLMGALLVGSSFAKSMAMGLNIPLIEVNHMQGHILAHFIKEKDGSSHSPLFPFLCLTVSGGHTQIVLVRDYLDMEIMGETTDDAAGEAFDKIAKTIGLPYPGGPLVDKLAREGNPGAFSFPHPEVPGLNFSFSGLKTAFLYFIRDNLKENPGFIAQNKTDICASIQKTIIDILMNKLKMAALQLKIKDIAIAGGVSANSGLRLALKNAEVDLDWKTYIPPLEYCTDNAAMIAVTGFFKYFRKEFSGQDASPLARYKF